MFKKVITISAFILLLTPSMSFGKTLNGNLTVNGTIITPTISNFTNATHTHQNGAGGGTLDAAAIATGVLPELRGGTGTVTSLGVGEVRNCGISVSGSTLTIAGRDGSALSASAPCLIGIMSNTAGRVTTASFTANVTVTFGAASNTDGNLFGITDVNWPNIMPLLLGVIYNGTTPYFTISRVPTDKSGGLSSRLCQKDDTDCDAQEDVMILATGLTLSGFINLPITQVGWFNATYATSGGAWTFTVSHPNGFNHDYGKTFFSMPTGQNGADTGTFFYSNGGTAPIWSTNSLIYQINEDGNVVAQFWILNDGGTDGAGAVNSKISIPYAMNTTATGTMRIINQSTSFLAMATCEAGDTFCNIYRQASLSGNLTDDITSMLNSDFSNGNRNIYGTLIAGVSK